MNRVEEGPPAGGAAGARDEFYLSFENIKSSVDVSGLNAMLMGTEKGTMDILRGVSGKVKAGEVLAIIGGSGAGKTSLLNVLARKNLTGAYTVSGRVRLGGKAMNSTVFRQFCGYVPQEDSLWAMMTVREHLDYAARLYNPYHSDAEREEIVMAVVSDLGLEACQNRLIGNVIIRGVSGGQRKRASVGVELVGTTKKCLLLDECTSGLDASAAGQLMGLLRSLATSRNLVVVSTIHQPSSKVFLNFDQVLLLARGSTVYFGPAAESLAYFEAQGKRCDPEVNPADFIVEISNADFTPQYEIDRLVHQWDDRQMVNVGVQGSETPGIVVPHREPLLLVRGGANQLRVLVERTIKVYTRDPVVYTVRMGVHAFMSFYLASVYYQITDAQEDVMDRVFLNLWIQAFNSYFAMGSLPAFALEKLTVSREIDNGQYSAGQYCIVMALVQMPFVFIGTVMAVAPVYWITDMNDDVGRFWQYCCVVFGLLYSIESLSVLVGAAVKYFIFGLAIMASVISCEFIMNGFFVAVDNIPYFYLWLYYISPFKYSYEACVHLTFKGRPLDDFDSCTTTCFGNSGDDVLQRLENGGPNLLNINVGLWILVLLGISAVYRVMHYAILRSQLISKE